MTERDITYVLVDIIKYDYLRPPIDDEDAVYGFTHSREINAICADMLPPHTVTPIEKAVIEDALDDYLQRRGVSTADEARIRAWLAGLPDEIAIIEREP